MDQYYYEYKENMDVSISFLLVDSIYCVKILKVTFMLWN